MNYTSNKLKELRLWIVQIGFPLILLYLYINDKPELKKRAYKFQKFFKEKYKFLTNKFKNL